MDLADVRGVDVAALEDLATSLASRASSLEEARGQFAKITQFPGWSGSAKDAATGSFQRADASLLDDVARVSATHQAVLELSADFAQLQSRVRELEREAASLGAVLGDDGAVALPEGADPAQQHRALIIGGEAYELMLDADRIDEKAGDVLRRAANGEITAQGAESEGMAALAGAVQGTLGTPEPPKGQGGGPVAPQYNTAWWNDLTPEQRAWVKDSHPEWMANLDGVSAKDRDEVNRKRLPEEIARLQAEVDRLQKQKDSEFGHGAFSNTDSDLWYAQRRLEGAKATEQALKENPGSKLMVLDPDDGARGRVAIAVGDPDTADRIAVTAPGVNSSPGQSIAGMTEEATALKAETENVLKANSHGNETVATIAWIGYEPPQAQLDPSHLDKTGEVGPGGVMDEMKGLSDVGSDAQAKAGAASLSRFYEGISSAWRPGEGGSPAGPHITALGHSYGSLTTSLALQQTLPGIVDSAVFYGSPGLELSSPDRLPVPAGHAFAMQTDNDPIGIVTNVPEPFQRYGPSPAETPGITRLSTHAGDTHGDAPRGQTVHHDGAAGHSEYSRTGGNQLVRMPGYNMAAVIAGMAGQDGRRDVTVKGE